MKRYLISTFVVLAILALTWAVFGQEGERARGGAGPGGGRGGFMMPEEQLKVLEAIEQQVGKLKETVKASALPAGKTFQDLSDEERTKMRQAREERQAAIKTVLTQLARLQGQQPAEGAEYIIVNTADLKAIQELATKEKATETANRLTSLIERPQRGMGRRAGQPPAEAGPVQKPAEQKPAETKPKG
jgi:hypothetical protein